MSVVDHKSAKCIDVAWDNPSPKSLKTLAHRPLRQAAGVVLRLLQTPVSTLIKLSSFPARALPIQQDVD